MEQRDGHRRPVRRGRRRRPGDDVRLRVRRDRRRSCRCRSGSRTSMAERARRTSARRASSTSSGPTARRRCRSSTRTACPKRLDTVLISTQHHAGINIDDELRARVDRARHPAVVAGAVRRRRLRDLREPDRAVRARRPARRLRAHRPQDHRRHLRRHGPPRRRRVLGQGPDQGRPLGRVRGAPDREGGRRGRARQAVRGAGRVRDRCRAPDVDHGRHVRHVARSRPTSSRRWSARCSTCGPPRSSSASTCAARSSGAPRRTATSVAPTATASPGRTSSRTPPSCAAPARRVARRGLERVASRSVGSLPTSPRSSASSTISFPTSSPRSCASGTIVRVPLHGRHGARLGGRRRRQSRGRRRACCSSVLAVVSDGSAARRRRAERVDRAGAGAARASRCCAPRRPPNRVRPAPHDRTGVDSWHADRAQSTPVRRERWWCGGRRCSIGATLVASMCAADGSTIVCGRRRRRAARSLAQYLARGRAHGRVAAFGRVRRGAHRRVARAAARGACVVVGGRVAALAPVPDLARRDRRRRRRRGAAGRTRRPRGTRATCCSSAPHARRRAVDRGVARADGRGARARGRARSTRRPPTSRRAAGRACWSSTGARSRRARACSPSALADALRDADGLGGLRAQPAGPVPAARVRRVPRAAALGPQRRPTGRCVRDVRRDAAARAARRRDRVSARSSRRCSRRAPSSTSTPTRARSARADIVVGTEAVLHRARAPPAPARARRVPRSRPGAARAAVPRRRASALARRPAARSCSPGRPRAETRLLVQTRHARPRGRARARRGTARARHRSGDRHRRTRSGYPPFGALAELTGDDAAVRAAVDAARGFLGDPGASVRPTGGRSCSRADADALADALAAVRAGAAGRAIGSRPVARSTRHAS